MQVTVTLEMVMMRDELKKKKKTVSAVDVSKRVCLLAGHEGRVYTVGWGNKGELLTASMDR